MTVVRIDVHHHILPSHYVNAVGAQLIGAQGSSGRLPDWSINRSVELMDAAGISASITSISAPGVAPLDVTPAVELARRCNDFAAAMVRDHAGRFGFFATLPLQSIHHTIREVEYAYATLAADGVCLLSNYNGHYLGHTSFHPLYEELDRRGAVVFVHPTSPQHRIDLPGLSPSMLEFPFDTTRTVASLIFSGVIRRFPAIRWIFAHAGGALPYLAGRFELLSRNSPALREHIPGGFYEAIQPLYFDTALSADAAHFATLRALLPDGQILFGTDYPFGPKDQMAAGVRGLESLSLAADTLAAVYDRNAKSLFPRVHAALAKT